MLLQLKFGGWFEIRCTTDPDPTDEKRGVSGYTFATPEEPNLDRIVRFQGWVAPRSHGPDTRGVFVTEVAIDGVVQADHVLVGAPIHLLDNPTEEQRNDALNPQMGPQPGYMYLHPFHIQVGEAKSGFVLARRDDLVPGNTEAKLRDASYEQLKRRGFTSMGLIPDDGTFQRVTGQPDPVTYRLRRRGLVAQELAHALDGQRLGLTHRTGPDGKPEDLDIRWVIASLQQRYRQLLNPNAADRPTVRLQAMWARAFAINGGVTQYVDTRGALPGAPDAAQDWPVAFWFGIFDADLNVAWAEGTLTVPLIG